MHGDNYLRRSNAIAGAIAHVSHFPCVNYAKMLAAAGVRTINYPVDYDDDPIVLDLLAEAGVQVIRF